MTRKKNIWITLTFVFSIVILCVIYSCKTTKIITETIHTHDTLTVLRTDTVREVKIKSDTVVDCKTIHLYDTIFRDRGQVIVLSEQGDTLKQKAWDNLWQRIHELEHSQHNESHVDSTSYYKAENERLRQVLAKEQSKEKVAKVVKKPRLIDMAVLMLVCLACVMYVLRKKK